MTSNPTPLSDDPADSPAPRRPWYRHVWVPVVGALVLALLAFGSGFVAGQATWLFRAATVSSGDAPAWGDRDADGRDGGVPGWRDGGPGRHGGDMSGLPGQRGGGDSDSDSDSDTQ